jgi:bifunctional DNase/RNase
MEKVKLVIAGLSYSQTQSGAYALMLVEVGGKRRVPIIIGGFEAQAIAVELEKMKPTRPLTHDLFKSFALAYDIFLKEVIIYNFHEGIFYAKLICEKDGVVTEIDSRTSDAIAISVRFNCPIFTYSSILEEAGTIIEEGFDLDEIPEEEDFTEEADEGPLVALSLAELEDKLIEAIENEDYETASKIRDELKKHKP